MFALSLRDSGLCNSRAYPLRLGHCVALCVVPQFTFGLAPGSALPVPAIRPSGPGNIPSLSGV